MIGRSRFRRAGGLGKHLGRKDRNEKVEILDDLCRDSPSDTVDALKLFTAISRTSHRLTRDLIHIKISPASELNNSQIGRVIQIWEDEHRIPKTMPRHVVKHDRGPRAPHVHVVYPILNPVTGKAVRSTANYFADEIASRRVEIEFGEPIVPGPRQTAVAAELRRRGLIREADIVGAHAPVRAGNRVGDNTRQQAAAQNVDEGVLMTLAYDAWCRAAGDGGAFSNLVGAVGCVIAMGDKAILMVDEASGVHIPLARALRQRAKEAGTRLAIRDPDLRTAFDTAPNYTVVRDRGLAREEEKAAGFVADEIGRMADEAAIDGQQRLAERLRLVREQMRLESKARARSTLKARRAAIRADYARRDRLRRARVNRAFAAAEMLDRPELRRATFALAGAGILLAGGGLGLALVIAGVAVAALPSRERARAIAVEIRMQRAADRDATTLAATEAYRTLEAANFPRVAPIRFDSIGKRIRGIAGLYAHTVLTAHELTGPQAVLRAAAQRILGDQAAGIEAAVLQASGRAGLTMLTWYDPGRAQHRQAAALVLDRMGESAAARGLAPSATRDSRRDTGLGR